MSKQDKLGRHWRVKQTRFELFFRDKRSEHILETVAAVPTKQKHKCGGTIFKAAGLPSIFRWNMCGKCSASVK